MYVCMYVYINISQLVVVASILDISDDYASILWAIYDMIYKYVMDVHIYYH